MKAVILAAGHGTRLRPMTDTLPKALVPVNGKPLLTHILDTLVGLVEEVILVTGYKGEMIREHFGDSYQGISVTYVVQTERNGTGHALLCAKKHLSGKFLVLNGDDIFSRDDIAELLNHQYGVLAHEVSNPSSFGVFRVEGTKLLEIVEKPSEFISNLVNVGVYLFDDTIFAHELKPSPRGELEIVDYLNYLKDRSGVDVCRITHFWYPINTLEQLSLAEKQLE